MGSGRKNRKGGRREGDHGRANGANGRRRANNTGTLEKRGNKWLARWYVYTPQGKRVRKSQIINASGIDEAREKLRELTEGNALMSAEKDLKRDMERLQGVRAELQRVEDSRPALSLADMFEAFKYCPRKMKQKKRECGDDTMRMYESQVARFVEWIATHYPEAKEMRQVSEGMADEFLKYLKQNFSPNTHNKYALLLNLIWRTLFEKAKCTVNPWKSVDKVAQSKTTGRRSLTVEELNRVWATITGEMRILFALGFYTGLRLCDCALMEWGSVDMVRGFIITTPRKTKRYEKEVLIKIHPLLFAILNKIPPQQRTGFILRDTAETYKRDTSAIAARIRRVFESAGISTRAEVNGYSCRVAKVGFHSLRHTFVSILGNKGTPLPIVQSLVGHKNPMMTAHYFHAQTDAIADAIYKLPVLTGETTDIIDVEASVSPVEREDAPSGTTTPPDAETRLEAFYAAFTALSPDERKTAAKWMTQQRATA